MKIGKLFWDDITRVLVTRHTGDTESLFFSTRREAEDYVYLIPWLQRGAAIEDEETAMTMVSSSTWSEIKSAKIIPTGLVFEW